MYSTGLVAYLMAESARVMENVYDQTAKEMCEQQLYIHPSSKCGVRFSVRYFPSCRQIYLQMFFELDDLSRGRIPDHNFRQSGPYAVATFYVDKCRGLLP